MELTVEEKTTLLSLARQAVRLDASGSDPGMPSGERLTAALRERSGAFVSIYEGTTLRGSMGYILPVLPLWQVVRDCAVYAAFRDPRFSPLPAGELDAVTLEIAVITSRRRTHEIPDLRSGTRGIILQRGFRRAVMLPHDAEPERWNTRDALAYLRNQIGLDGEGQGGHEILEVFAAEVIREP